MPNNLTLADAIKLVLPHASTDKTLPILTTLQVLPDGIFATDRYTCARVTIATGIPEGQSLLLPADIAKRGVAAIHQDAGGWFATCVDQSVIRFTPAEGDYPNIAQLFDGFTPATEGHGPGVFGLTAAFAEKFAPKHLPGRPAANRHEVMRVEPSANSATKPVRVTFPQYPQYQALWVPVRLAA